jgi:hypothetical protein
MNIGLFMNFGAMIRNFYEGKIMSSGFENTKYKKTIRRVYPDHKGGYAKCHPPTQDLAQMYITGIKSHTSDIIVYMHYT